MSQNLLMKKDTVRYYMTDFYPWEKPLKEQLIKEGKHIYSLIDTGGIHFQISHGFVNRYGYVVTDKPLPLKDGFMSDVAFDYLDKIEDRAILNTINDISAQVEVSKREYISKEAERNKVWENIVKYQNKIMKLEREKGLKPEPEMIDYTNGQLCIQGLSEEDDKLYVRYFIRNEGKTKDRKLEIPYDRIKRRAIINRINKKEGLGEKV